MKFNLSFIPLLNSFSIFFFLSFFVTLSLGCLRTEHKLFLKESERKAKSREALIKKADNEARWEEIQIHLRNFNGRIEALEEKIEKQSSLLKENKNEIELQNEMTKEKLTTFVEALKNLEVDLKKIKQTVLQKKSTKRSYYRKKSKKSKKSKSQKAKKLKKIRKASEKNDSKE